MTAVRTSLGGPVTGDHMSPAMPPRSRDLLHNQFARRRAPAHTIEGCADGCSAPPTAAARTCARARSPLSRPPSVRHAPVARPGACQSFLLTQSYISSSPCTHLLFVLRLEVNGWPTCVCGAHRRPTLTRRQPHLDASNLLFFVLSERCVAYAGSHGSAPCAAPLQWVVAMPRPRGVAAAQTGFLDALMAPALAQCRSSRPVSAGLGGRALCLCVSRSSVVQSPAGTGLSVDALPACSAATCPMRRDPGRPGRQAHPHCPCSPFWQWHGPRRVSPVGALLGARVRGLFLPCPCLCFFRF